MKLVKMSLVAALLASSGLLADETSDIEVSANVALTSNYIWRGMTQSDDSPAIQGGFDLGYKGLYAGVWGSNIDFGDGVDASVELDFYAGYANEIAGIGYDIGYIQYTYPNDTDALNFGEAYLGLSYDFEVVAISGKYYVGVDTNDADNSADDWEPENGYELGASVPLPWEMSADATYGDYDKTGEYYYIGLTKTLGKFDFTVAYTGMEFDDSATEDQDNVVATISSSF